MFRVGNSCAGRETEERCFSLTHRSDIAAKHIITDFWFDGYLSVQGGRSRGAFAMALTATPATISFKWIDILEKEFDKSFVALEEMYRCVGRVKLTWENIMSGI